jgi:hypothetical protein
MRIGRIATLTMALAIVSPNVGIAQALGTLSGVVREDSTNRPIPNAEVAVAELKRITITDASGHFVLNEISAGVHSVSVKRLGFRPLIVSVQFLPGETVEKSFALAAVPLALDTLRVKAGPNRVLTGRDAFYERRQRGFGRLLDSMDLLKYPAIHVSSLLESENGIRVIRAPPCKPYTARLNNCVGTTTYLVAVSRSGCAMKIMLDNMVLARGGPIDDREVAHVDPRHAWYSMFDLSTVSLGSLEKVEIYRRAVEVPPDYQAEDTDCGLLIMWTKQ